MLWTVLTWYSIEPRAKYVEVSNDKSVPKSKSDDPSIHDARANVSAPYPVVGHQQNSAEYSYSWQGIDLTQRLCNRANCSEGCLVLTHFQIARAAAQNTKTV